MKTYEVDVMQFVLPHGQQKPCKTDLPIATQEAYQDMLAHGCRFEAEVLTTGAVSVTISNADEDVDMSITDNGPAVPQGMCDMLNRGLWKEGNNR